MSAFKFALLISLLWITAAPEAFAAGKDTEYSAHFRALHSGTGGLPVYGIRYRNKALEGTAQLYCGLPAASLAWKKEFNTDGFLVPNLYGGFAYALGVPGLVIGPGLALKMFKGLGGRLALRLDHTVYVFPYAKMAFAPVYTVGVSLYL